MEIAAASRAFRIKAPPPVMGLSPGIARSTNQFELSVIGKDDYRHVAGDTREREQVTHTGDILRISQGQPHKVEPRV